MSNFSTPTPTLAGVGEFVGVPGRPNSAIRFTARPAALLPGVEVRLYREGFIDKVFTVKDIGDTLVTLTENGQTAALVAPSAADRRVSVFLNTMPVTAPTISGESVSEHASRWLIETGNAIGRVIAPIAFVLMVAVVAAYAWNQIETLFRMPLQQTGSIIGIPVSHFAAATSVGMTLVMLMISKYSPHSTVRAGATIWAVTYIAVSFVLVFIAWALAPSGGKAISAVVQDAQSILPFLPLIGSAAVVVLASLGLVCFGVLVGASKNAPDRFETENRARGHLIGNAAKVVVSLGSVGFSIWFGVTVLGVNPALAALLGLVLDIGLINSWSKSESAAEAGDMEEARRWRGWAYIFGFAVALMAVESVGTQFKTSAAAGNQAVSHQLAALLNSDIFGLMQAIGAIAIIGAIGLSIVQLLLTMRPIGRTQSASRDTITVRTPAPLSKRIAGSIRNARAGIGEIREAWNEGKTALPPGNTQMAIESVAVPPTSDTAGEEVATRHTKS